MMYASARTVIGLSLAVPRRAQAASSKLRSNRTVDARTAVSSSSRSAVVRASAWATGTHVFAYRALRIARGDTISLPGFDENTWVPVAHADARTTADLLDELTAVRASTVRLLRSFDDAAWARRGTASDKPITVRALAYIIAGHELHHLAILKERYR